MRRIPALRPDRFVFRVSFWAGLTAWFVLVALKLGMDVIFNAAGFTQLPFVLVLVVWTVVWLLERRPAVWICDQGNGALAVRKRHVFFWLKSGPELQTYSADSHVRFEPGPWWSASRLWIDGTGYWVLGDGDPHAKQLIARRSEQAPTTR